MKTILLSAVCALGLALAASTGASAAPLASGLSNNSVSTNPLLHSVARVCRVERHCWRGPYGRRHCEVRRVCRRF